MTYDLMGAFAFYQTHIIVPYEAKKQFYTQRCIRPEGTVHFRDWEVFAAILVNDRGRNTEDDGLYGSDLRRHEVKSAADGASFEYQYHRHGGEVKYRDDAQVDHILLAYSQSYRTVDVYRLTGSQFAEYSQSWLPALQGHYTGTERQRFRKSLPFGFVKKKGILVMRIRQALLMDVRLRPDEGRFEVLNVSARRGSIYIDVQLTAMSEDLDRVQASLREAFRPGVRRDHNVWKLTGAEELRMELTEWASSQFVPEALNIHLLEANIPAAGVSPPFLETAAQ